MSGDTQEAFDPIIKLAVGNEVDGFDCGKEELNRFLKRFALAGQQANSAQTYVAAVASGSWATTAWPWGGVEHEAAPERVSKGLARHMIPVMVLGRLAIDLHEQGQGLRKGLLKDALRRTAAAADIAGIRALFVTAQDDDARRFYEHYDFDPSPADPHDLFLVMKDLKRLV